MVKWCENLLLLDLVNVDGYGWRVEGLGRSGRKRYIKLPSMFSTFKDLPSLTRRSKVVLLKVRTFKEHFYMLPILKHIFFRRCHT